MDFCKPVVSAILQKHEDGVLKVFIQTRWKPNVSPTYTGLLEIPAGAIEPYENIYTALKREVKEECGLDIVEIINDDKTEIYNPRKGDKNFAFKPFICQQVLETNDGLPWIGFVFLCEVEGEVKMDNKEAKDPKWMTIQELKEIVTNSPEKIFSLQLGALNYYLNHLK